MDRSTLAYTLLTLRHEGRSGVLEVRADGVRTFLYLLRGQLVFAEEESIGETLGRMLVRQRKLTQEQYMSVIERMTSALFDNEQLRFGEVAVELGYLNAAEVQGALADQVKWKVVRTLQREAHEFVFRESTGQAETDVRFPLVLEALILEACRWVPDERKKRTLDGVASSRFVTLSQAPERIAQRFSTTPEETEFLASIDGTRSFKDLLESAREVEADVPALLTALLTARAIQLSSELPPEGPQGHAPPAITAPTPAQEIRVAPPPSPAKSSPLPSAPPSDGVHRSAVATPLQFVPYKAAAKPAPAPPAPHAEPSTARVSKEVAKERADRALAMLRQSRELARKQVTAAIPKADPTDVKAAPTEHERRLLAEQEFQRGKQHLGAGRHQLALGELERARDLMPDSIEYELYARWAGYLAGPTDVDAARAELKRLTSVAVKADPNSAFAYFVLGEMALAEKNEAMANRAFSHAVKLDPNQLDAQRRLRLLVRK